MIMSTQAIEKVLSANDTGETGGHQAGILVPKDVNILSFFPQLDKGLKNPRMVMDIIDDSGREWSFVFVYYNNRFFGGTRNEYRLTGMTSYFREFNLKAGDVIIFRRHTNNYLTISYKRNSKSEKILRLSSTWKVIDAEF